MNFIPSFHFVPIPPIKITQENFVLVFQQELTKFSRSEDHWGTLPTSIIIENKCKYFELAYEKSHKYQAIDGSINNFNLIRRIPLIILRDDLIAIGNPRSNMERERIIKFIKDKFISGFVLKTMKFDQKILGKGLNNEVIEIAFQPTSQGDNAIDKIKAKGRSNILDTDFIEEHKDKPMKEIKFHIKSINEDIGVKFFENGVVNLPNNIHKKLIILLLTHIADKIIAPNLRGKKFSKTLDFFQNK